LLDPDIQLIQDSSARPEAIVRDMMVPRVAQCIGRNIDILTGKAFALTNALSVRSAVQSGAVGMGSFVVPFLHYGPTADFRHLCATRYSTGGKSLAICCQSQDDTLLAVGCPRPTVALVPEPPSVGGQNAHRYQGTSDLRTWLKDLRNGPVLFHVDMDYFNNRFDGDSDWIDQRGRHDPLLVDVLGQIDAIFTALAEGGVSNRIEDCSVSLSPSFFPAEFWEPSIERLAEQIEHLHAQGLWHAG
jgi:hypothetical protein